MRTSSCWLTKICNRYRGKEFPLSVNYYLPQKIGPAENIYQSPDFNWVFLGSAEQDDLKKVQQISGRPVCVRLDLTDKDTSHLPRNGIKIPFPEFNTWTEPQYDQVQHVFNETVDFLSQLITQNRHCPIYVHCSAGMNRSVAILASALANLTGRPLNTILSEMKSIRGIILPHDVYYMMALENSQSDSPETKADMKDQLNLDREHVLVS